MVLNVETVSETRHELVARGWKPQPARFLADSSVAEPGLSFARAKKCTLNSAPKARARAASAGARERDPARTDSFGTRAANRFSYLTAAW